MKSKFGLTEIQIENFKRDGYCGPFDLYEEGEIKKIYKKVRSQLFDRSHAVYDLDNTSLLHCYDRHLDVDLLSEHIIRQEVVDKLVSVLGPDVLCWRSEMFPKYPGDEGTDWHQADTFEHASGKPQLVWPHGSGFGGTITVWTAFTDSDIENGCLKFIPGTQEEMMYDESKDMKYSSELMNSMEKNGVRSGFFGYDYRNLQKDPDFVPDESQAIPIQMKAGQFVMFWSTLMHASYPNSSKNRTRLGFSSRYVPTSVQVYPDTDVIEEFGSVLSLDKYGTIVVAGEDRYGHNRTVEKNARGTPFTRQSVLAECG